MIATTITLLISIFTLIIRSNSINEIENNLYKYNILIDAGSTGSRLYLYRFTLSSPQTENNTTTMSKIAASLTEITQYRLHPAMSSFVSDLKGLSDQINDLLSFAKMHINESYWKSTFVSLKATAGLRSLAVSEQTYLMDNAYNIIERSDFACNKNDIRVISGNEEALYAYITTIIAFSTNSSCIGNHDYDIEENKFITKEISGLSAVDLGSSSKQLAFIVPGNISMQQYDYCDKSSFFHLPKLLGNETVYADSFVGKGLIAIMEHVLDVYIQKNAAIDHTNETCNENNFDGYSYLLDESVLASHPCLSPSSVFSYTFLKRDVNLTGSGDFNECVEFVRDQVVKIDQIKCIKSLLTTSINKVIGMDNIPKILEMLHIASDSPLSPQRLSEVGRIACKKPWEQLLSEFPSYPSYRAQRACFGASYIYVLMTEIYGIEENDSTKLMPLETYDKFTLSWPLGSVIVDSLDYLLN